MNRKESIIFIGFVVIITLFSIFVIAVEGDEDITRWNFTVDYGTGTDRVRGIAVDSSDNYYVAGSRAISFAQDWWIKKYYNNGTEEINQWNLSFDGNGSGNGFSPNIESAFAVAVDSNDFIYVVGTGRYINNSPTEKDWWIKKFNTSGTEYNKTSGWNKTEQGSGSADIAYAVATDSVNNVYVAGYGSNLTVTGSGADWWIKKYSSAGVENTTHWNKSFNGNGTGADEVRGLAFDGNNSLYAVGSATDLYNATSGLDWWIKKFYYNGSEDVLRWNKTYDGTGQDDAALAVAVDSNEHVYVVGYGTDLLNSTSGQDWWIKKFYPNGTEFITGWNKTYSTGSGNDDAYAVAVNSFDDVYVVGTGANLVLPNSQDDFWLKKFNSSGTENTTSWDKRIHGGGVDPASADPGYGIAIDSNDNITTISEITLGLTSVDWNIKRFEGRAAAADTSAPVVTFVNPANNSNLSFNFVNFNATVVDASPLDTVYFMFNTNTTAFNATATNSSATAWGTIVNVTNIVQGRHIVNVYANDSLGFNSTTTNISITVDREAPNVSMQTADFSTSSVTPSVDIISTDNFSVVCNCTFYIDGSAVLTDQQVVNATLTTITATSSVAAGTHSAYVNCTDYSGNTGNSSTITITVTATAAASTSSGGGGGGGGGSGGCATGYTASSSGGCVPVQNATTPAQPNTANVGTGGGSGLVPAQTPQITDTETPQSFASTQVPWRFTWTALRDIFIDWFWLVVVLTTFTVGTVAHSLSEPVKEERKIQEAQALNEGFILER